MSLCNSYRTLSDSLGGLENWYLSQTFASHSQQPDEAAAQINAVTRQEKDMLVQVLKEYRENKGIELLTKNVFDINGIDDMTAYYGSPSPLICRFVQQRKPAMVSEEQ